jgi:hypothetical protein
MASPARPHWDLAVSNLFRSSSPALVLNGSVTAKLREQMHLALMLRFIVESMNDAASQRIASRIHDFGKRGLTR